MFLVSRAAWLHTWFVTGRTAPNDASSDATVAVGAETGKAIAFVEILRASRPKIRKQMEKMISQSNEAA